MPTIYVRSNAWDALDPDARPTDLCAGKVRMT